MGGPGCSKSGVNHERSFTHMNAIYSRTIIIISPSQSAIHLNTFSIPPFYMQDSLLIPHLLALLSKTTNFVQFLKKQCGPLHTRWLAGHTPGSSKKAATHGSKHTKQTREPINVSVTQYHSSTRPDISYYK